MMAADELDDLEPTAVDAIVSDRWRVAARLAEGGMGVLYLAQDEKNNQRRVVLKFPKKSLLFERGFRERFDRETRSLFEFEHPHVVRVHDTGMHGTWPYVVLQYLSGGSLLDRIRQRVQTPADLTWLPQVAAALDAVHKHGFVHRDVKTANILFGSHGEAYLSDFGIIKIVASLDREGTLTQGGMLGSPDSFAPECVDASPTSITPAYDQFGLAMAVYRALSGRQPFEAPSTVKLLMRLATERPPPLDQIAPVSTTIANVVAKAMSIDPTHRFPSCGEFASALDEAKGPRLTAALPTSVPTPSDDQPTQERSHQQLREKPSDAASLLRESPSATPARSRHAKVFITGCASIAVVLGALFAIKPLMSPSEAPGGGQPVAVAEGSQPSSLEQGTQTVEPSPIQTPIVAEVPQPSAPGQGELKPYERRAVEPSPIGQLTPEEMNQRGVLSFSRTNPNLQNDTEAVKWFKLAAAGNDAKGQANLGFMYETGRGGLKADDADAANWYRRAAQQGNAEGQAKLGIMYDEGRGGSRRDTAAAANWYRLAAEQGNAEAQARLARLYRSGDGVPRDDVAAAKWYKLAAEQGNRFGLINLAIMYTNGWGGLPKDEAEALKWYKVAADQGDASGQLAVGRMYEKGLGGLTIDDLAAVKWYKLAADQGDPFAQLKMGRMYEDGRGGLTKDEGAAVRWYRLAAQLAFEDALERLLPLARRGNGDAQQWLRSQGIAW